MSKSVFWKKATPAVLSAAVALTSMPVAALASAEDVVLEDEIAVVEDVDLESIAEEQASAGEYVYGTANLPYADFFFGELQDVAVDARMYFIEDGTRYHHILDPKTGSPVHNGLTSVTVVCDSGLLADGLSTACFVLGLDDALQLLEKYDADAIFADEEKNLYLTGGMEERFELLKSAYTVRAF